MITRSLGWKVHLILQLAAVSALCLGVVNPSTALVEANFLSIQPLENIMKEVTWSLIGGLLGMIYLLESSVVVLTWFLGNRYPESCFSPRELSNFLANVDSSQPHCFLKVAKQGSACSSERKMSKEFIPTVWTEVTEDVDVVGARKSRIKSAQNMSDVLEELLSKNKVIIIEITTEVVPADDISKSNTEQFIAKHTDSARITFNNPVQATFVVDLSSFPGPCVETLLNVTEDGLGPGSQQNEKNLSKRKLGKLAGPRLTVLLHREMDLPIFWYTMWKYKSIILIPATLCPVIGTLLKAAEDYVPRHSMNIRMKFNYMPKAEVMYTKDRVSKEMVWEEEIQKVTIVLPQYRILVPRDSLTKIVVGDMDVTNMETLETRKQFAQKNQFAEGTSFLTLSTDNFPRSRTPRNSCSDLHGIYDPPPSYTPLPLPNTNQLSPAPDYHKIVKTC